MTRSEARSGLFRREVYVSRVAERNCSAGGEAKEGAGYGDPGATGSCLPKYAKWTFGSSPKPVATPDYTRFGAPTVGERLSSHAFMSYGIGVYEYRNPRAQVDLAAFGDAASHDLLNFLRDELQRLEHSSWVDVDRNAYVNTQGVADDGNRSLKGFIRTGDWGVEAEGRDINTDALAYRREPDHVELQPFYFRCFLPRRRQAGILLTEMIGNLGVKNLFWEHRVKSAFHDEYPGYSIKFEPIYPENVWRTFMEHEQASVKNVRLRRQHLGPDVADIVGGSTNVEETAVVEVNTSPNDGLGCHENG